MSVAVVRSRALAGLAAPPVEVEVHIAGGLPGVNLVGLPETEVREARDRVRAALQNANFEFPARKVTVNLAPADLPTGCSVGIAMTGPADPQDTRARVADLVPRLPDP